MSGLNLNRNVALAALVGGLLIGTQAAAVTYRCSVGNYGVAGTTQVGIAKVAATWFGDGVIIDLAKNSIQQTYGKRARKPEAISIVQRSARFTVYGFETMVETEGRDRKAKYTYRVYPDGRLKAFGGMKGGNYGTLTAAGNCR
ncbi:MAG: hypothetical protein WBC93_14870 [Sulfitobacter sp.]